MEPLLDLPASEIKALASKSLLTWQGKKIFFDPFLALDVVVEIEKRDDSLFTLTPRIVMGPREEGVEKFEQMLPLGALQGGVFRLWKERGFFKLATQTPSRLSAKELEAFLEQQTSFRWKGEACRLKPEPLPILYLTDQTGGFAKLKMDYGEWGEAPFLGKEEEKYWENDLLETGFKKKVVGASDYFCPLDLVGKSLAFLLDMGWKIVDCRGKRVVRQGSLECSAEEMPDAILLRGKALFGQAEVSIQDVMGAFERRQRWADLSPHEVGLIEVPAEWEAIVGEKRSPQGIHVKKIHVGLLSGVVPLSYEKVEWEEAAVSADFQGTLFPYQQKGVNWLSFLKRSGLSCLLADEMGLGKTVQMLAFLSREEGPTLIVAPVTLLSLWKMQIEQFLPDRAVYVHQGSKREEAIEHHSLILTSYATLRQDMHLFAQMSFETVVLDEAQTIKNHTTQIAQSVYRLKGNFRVALTGTPIENRLEELGSIFHFLIPTLDATNFKKVRPFILRRTKKEVGLDLPEKIVQTVGVPPSEEEFSLYENLLRTKRTTLLEQIAQDGLSAHRMQVLELILRLRQHSCHPRLVDPSYTGECQKFSRALSDLEEVVASSQKVLVYSQFTSMLHLFEHEFKERGWKYAYLDGSTKDREVPVSQFQNDQETKVFLISLKAGGVGLNLQAADYVFLYDPWWNSAAENQAIDRAHRIGRKETVIARKYFTTDSIEAKILDLQLKKEKTAQALWDEEVEVEELSFEEVCGLLSLRG